MEMEYKRVLHRYIFISQSVVIKARWKPFIMEFEGMDLQSWLSFHLYDLIII